MDFDIIVQSGQASFYGSAVCNSNRYIPIEGVFGASAASAKLYLIWRTKGRFLLQSTSLTIDILGAAVNFKLKNQWENVGTGADVVLGKMEFVYSGTETLPKDADMTFHTAEGKKSKVSMKGITTTGKALRVAQVVMTLNEFKNLVMALQEMKNGRQQNELKLACNAAYAG